MKTKFWAGLAAGVLLCGMTEVATAAVILNGGFDAGLTDWTVYTSPGTVIVINDGGTHPSVARMTGVSYMWQEYSWVAGEKLTFDYKDNHNSSLPTGQIVLQIFNASSSEEITIPLLGDSAWHSFTYTAVGSGSGTVVFCNLFSEVGDTTYTLFDNISSTASVPEPSSAMLIGFGALSLLGCRRPRKAGVKS